MSHMRGKFIRIGVELTPAQLILVYSPKFLHGSVNHVLHAAFVRHVDLNGQSPIFAVCSIFLAFLGGVFGALLIQTGE